MTEFIIKIDQEIEIANIKDIIIRTHDGQFFEVSPHHISLKYRDDVAINLQSEYRCPSVFLSRQLTESQYQIANCQRLTVDLRNCHIDKQELDLIIKELDHDLYISKLYGLHLSNNRIDVHGLAILLEFLAKCPKFEQLNCDINHFIGTEFNRVLADSKLSQKNFAYHCF